MARHHIDISRMRHQEKLTLERRRRREEAFKETLAAQSNESDDYEFPSPDDSDDSESDETD